MWIDLLISAPVTLFLIWLYWYSAPPAAPRWSRGVDRAVLLAAPLAVIAVITIGHRTIDWSGAGLNVMVVAGAYLCLLALLGAGWVQRSIATGRARARSGNGFGSDTNNNTGEP